MTRELVVELRLQGFLLVVVENDQEVLHFLGEDIQYLLMCYFIILNFDSTFETGVVFFFRK
jgi:hypothetical protein